MRGVGIGLRAPHAERLLNERPVLPFLEALSDNYLTLGSLPFEQLMQLRAHYPVVLHGVGLSLGSADPLNEDYLDRLAQLVRHAEPLLVSDHLSWSSIDGRYLHDLLPLPQREEVVEHVAGRIERVQERLGCRLLIENPSSYRQMPDPEMPEWEFLSRVAERADCEILLDINNVYVNAFNHGFDALHYLNAIPVERVKQFHLAGFEDRVAYLLDDHGAHVHADVWKLYRVALERFGPQPSVIEWDTRIPELDVLLAEAQHGNAVLSEVHADAS